MIRALLDGSKTQTRRLVKPQPQAGITDVLPADPSGFWGFIGNDPIECIHCPYGEDGDRLWVRETFKAITSGEIRDGYGELRLGFAYQADSATIWRKNSCIVHDLTSRPPTGAMQFQPRPWKPSTHMPRRASRLTLEITDVRIERLQHISEADAIAEGVWTATKGAFEAAERGAAHNQTGAFIAQWEDIHGAGSWDKNQFVWVLAFKRV